MATKLTKPVSRELKVVDEFGNEGDVIITMKTSGLEIRKKSTSRTMFIEWEKVGKVFQIPPHAPSRYLRNPLGWMTQD